DAVGALVVHAQAGDQIGRALDAGVAAIEHVRVIEAVNQGEDPTGVAADIPTDRNALPEDFLRGRQILHVQGATAVTHADGGGPGGFFTSDIGGRAVALFGENAFNGRSHGLG